MNSWPTLISQLLMQDWNQLVCHHALIIPRYWHWQSLDSVPKPTLAPSSVDQTIGPSVSPTIDKFTTQYHPHSGRPPETQTFMDYSHKNQSSNLPPVNAEPWHPFFNTCEDFEFAEILMEAGVSKGHSERLLKPFKKCLSGNGTLSYSNYSDIKTSWDHAAVQLTPVSLITIL